MDAATLRERLAGSLGERAGIERAGTERTGIERTGIERTGIERTGIERTGIERTGTADDVLDMLDGRLVPAAVLVPIVTGPAAGVLLTQRTAHLTNHAGQVSFPGGRIDATDADAEAAALREAWEEIGLDPARVDVLGRLPDHVTGTGYRVTPVLGLLPPGLGFAPSPDEVEHVFELPMAVLLDPQAPQRRRVHYRGRWREFWVWPHPDHYIWGATAAILVTLARTLRGER